MLIHVAAFQGHLNVVEKLLDKGAQIYAKNNSGSTPIELANNENKLEIVSFFLDYKDKRGYTVLHYVALINDPSLTGFLLKKGAEIDAKNNEGYTPLHLAARYGKLSVVKELLDKSADINAKNNDGLTPLDIARDRKYSNIVKYFEEKLGKEREPVQRKRRHYYEDRNRHGHLSCKSLAIDSSNQLEIAISRAARESSWISDLFGWVKSSVGRFRAALPETSENGANYYGTTRNLSNQYIGQFSRGACISNNVGLGFFLLQSFLDRKYPLPKFCSATHEEVLTDTLNIMEEFKKTLKKTAKQSGVSVKGFDFFKVYSGIAGHVRNERYSKIPSTLYSAVEEAYPKNEKFLSTLKSSIRKVLDRQQMVNNYNQEQDIANVDPSFLLDRIVVESLNNKDLKGV